MVNINCYAFFRWITFMVGLWLHSKDLDRQNRWPVFWALIHQLWMIFVVSYMFVIYDLITWTVSKYYNSLVSFTFHYQFSWLVNPACIGSSFDWGWQSGHGCQGFLWGGSANTSFSFQSPGKLFKLLFEKSDNLDNFDNSKNIPIISESKMILFFVFSFFFSFFPVK